MPVSALAVRALGSVSRSPSYAAAARALPDAARSCVFSFGRGKEFGPIFLARPCWSFPLRVSSISCVELPFGLWRHLLGRRARLRPRSRPSRLASHPPNCSGLQCRPGRCGLGASTSPEKLLLRRLTGSVCGWGEREMCCGSRWQVGAVVDSAGHLHVILRLLCWCVTLA